jgi:hypothetical protein
LYFPEFVEALVGTALLLRPSHLYASVETPLEKVVGLFQLLSLSEPAVLAGRLRSAADFVRAVSPVDDDDGELGRAADTPDGTGGSAWRREPGSKVAAVQMDGMQ